MRDSTSYGPIASRAVKRSYSGIAICMAPPWGSGGLGRLETGAVVGGPDAEAAVKRAPHGLDRAEAVVAGDRLYGGVAGLERDAGRLHACRLDVGGRRHPELLAKRAREVALTHVGARGQRGHGQVGGEVVRDPLLQLA